MEMLKLFSKRCTKRIFGHSKKVVCIGLGKTGTTTFSAAMNILGFRHKTMGHRFAYAYGIRLPIRISLYKFDSFDDYPWPYLYEYIDHIYPHSKFIMTRRRSVDDWFRSLAAHNSSRGPTQNQKTFLGYNDPLVNEDRLKSLYLGHLERAREYFKGDPRYLEVCWEDGDGWEKVCDFLDLERPGEEFPWENKTISRSSSDKIRV